MKDSERLKQIERYNRLKANARERGVYFPGEDPKPKRPEDIVKLGILLWAEGDWVRHMAAALDVNPKTVQRWAAGETQPHPALWDKLHEIAQRRIAEIMKAI